jgi:hypothetical protein
MEKLPTNDKMPEYDGPEWTALEYRLLRLSVKELCDLLDIVGVTFINIGREELEESDKEELTDYLWEADSRAKVEEFLIMRSV